MGTDYSYLDDTVHRLRSELRILERQVAQLQETTVDMRNDIDYLMTELRQLRERTKTMDGPKS